MGARRSIDSVDIWYYQYMSQPWSASLRAMRSPLQFRMVGHKEVEQVLIWQELFALLRPATE